MADLFRQSLVISWTCTELLFHIRFMLLHCMQRLDLRSKQGGGLFNKCVWANMDLSDLHPKSRASGKPITPFCETLMFASHEMTCMLGAKPLWMDPQLVSAS